jgi:hypothetical protein
LLHPILAGLRHDASDLNFARQQPNDEENMVPDQSFRRPHFDCEKVRRGHDFPVHLEKFLPSHSLASLRRWTQTGFTQYLYDCPKPNFMTQVGQRTLNARVAPSPILSRDLQNQFLQVASGWRPAWSSLLTRVVLFSYQPAMPAQKSVRGYEACEAEKTFSTERLGFDRQAPPLIIIEARAFSQLLLENAYLLWVTPAQRMAGWLAAGSAGVGTMVKGGYKRRK